MTQSYTTTKETLLGSVRLHARRTDEKIVQWPAARPLPTAEPTTGISDFLDARFWNSAV